MPTASAPETPPPTAPTSPISPTGTDNFIDCEKGSVDEEVVEESDEKGSEDNSPDIPSSHREKDGRLKLIQRSQHLNHAWFDQVLISDS